MTAMTNLAASPAPTVDSADARTTLTTLHQHFSNALAAAHRVDPTSIHDEDASCPEFRLILRAQAETPVRARVFNTLIVAQASGQYGKALANLYNHAWAEVESGFGAPAEIAGWQRVAEAASLVMDAGLDAEIERLLQQMSAA